MKEFGKIKLQNAVALEEQEMKRIYGGSGSGGSGICMAKGNYASGSGMVLCTNDAPRAIAFAGENGWWCCNCDEAINTCSDSMC